MESPSDDLLPLLSVAAELRAGGTSWAKVGQQVERSPETCRQWPRHYPDTWRRLYLATFCRLNIEAGTSARSAVQNLLAHPDPKIVLAAGNLLARITDLELARQDRADRLALGPPPEVVAAHNQLKEIPDAQLAARVAHCLALLARPDAGAAAGTGAPPGPPQPQ
jgi:hypothetical protein